MSSIWACGLVLSVLRRLFDRSSDVGGASGITDGIEVDMEACRRMRLEVSLRDPGRRVDGRGARRGVGIVEVEFAAVRVRTSESSGS